VALQRRKEAETAAKRVDILEAHFAQVAIGIHLAIMMGEGHVAGLTSNGCRGWLIPSLGWV
jgi:hypothetical protein